MRKVGIFGGCFDPIHNGHISLAKDVVEQAGLDDFIFLPANIQPFKQDRILARANDRLMMLRMAIEEHPAFALSNYEFRQDGISYTYKTLRVFKEALGADTKIYFVCGTDSFLKIEKWKEAEELLTNYSFVVGTRPGDREDEIEQVIKTINEKYGTEVIRVDNKRIDLSSTMIRDAVKAGESIEGKVPEAVAEYIEDNDLYR